jgi:cytochrome c-type biogenesis protein CcmF
MQEIIYTGENLLIGNLGKLSVYLALAAAIFSFVAYSFANKNLENNGSFWNKMARMGFIVHCVSVFAIFTILFIIIQQHLFEYHYAWQHSSTDLPLRYMVSCFWEGQEGSFLLWMIWHVVLGFVLMGTSKKWESPVMAIMALAQVMLTSMLLGIEIGEFKIGSNPFTLLRDAVEAPIFSQPDYLAFIEDGNGLNPLLQNYWMVIHPPTLFLGFAASIVPFAFAVSGLWNRNYSEWIKPALPWTLFAVMVLGTGIIMGAFWAYESLTFGGYWAWDPVENASLIPWLILIASAHVMLIYQKTGKALYASVILSIFSFLLVLYATFLTRSGVLGDTSVHSFTDLGMSGQLLLFLLLFIWLPAHLAIRNAKIRTIFTLSLFGILAINILIGYINWLSIPAVIALILLLFVFSYKAIPKPNNDQDDLSSREFWMFIGALIFVISCFQIIVFTSIPVGNKLFGLSAAPPSDPIALYNQWQLPVALVVGLLMAFAQLLKYKKTSLTFYRNKIILLLTGSAVATVPFVFLFKLSNPIFIALLYASVAAVFGNLQYILQVLKGKIKLAGSSTAHIGFGLMLMGVIASGSGKKVISFNQSSIDFGEGFDEKGKRENVLLWRDAPTLMNDYIVTYKGDTTIHPNTYYKVHYQRVDLTTGKEKNEQFTLMPNAQINPKMGLVANPDTRHYLTHDVFTHVTQVPDKEGARKAAFTNFKTHTIQLGDTIITNNGKLVLDGVIPVQNKASLGLESADFVLMARIKVITLFDTLWAEPIYAIKGQNYSAFESNLHDAGLKIKLSGIKTDKKDITQTLFEIETGEKPPVQDYIILKAYVFPYINLLWGGTIIMVIGFAMSIVRRVKENQRKAAV